MTIDCTATEQQRHDPWRTESATIHRVRQESDDVNTYDLRFLDEDAARRYDYAPGQFNMLYLPGVGEAAISISGRTDQGHLRHTVRKVGDVTGALDRGGAGLSLGIRGPFGKPWPIDRLGRQAKLMDVILVAGGIGIAPLRSVIQHLMKYRERFGRVDLLLGARTPSDLIYSSEHREWSRHEIKIHTTVDRAADGWTGHVGVVTQLLDRLDISRPDSTLLMTCGPEVMMRFVVQAAASQGVPETNAWITMERNMNCAIGLCGHCQLGAEFMCKDGPVFRYDRIAPWLHVQGL